MYRSRISRDPQPLLEANVLFRALAFTRPPTSLLSPLRLEGIDHPNPGINLMDYVI